ncbi:patatin [Dyella dinghuensis]|uniref:Patatin n=2 Tax=Dyella dinghuensis TaxID=1920169 RepID=A0A432LWD6_9GAMM|nr:patatin [Dyella dinghuensis]
MACQGQILALSGGGFRGLYSAKLLASLEEAAGQPIARHFDLLGGTSIGGILALALACEIPTSRLVGLFEEHGDSIFKRRSWSGIFQSLYSPTGLANLLASEDIFGKRKLGDCVHRVIVPAINYGTGNPTVFKTPHDPSFRNDYKLRLVDVALATSAAPRYFPRHVVDDRQFVDGGLFANSPGLLALHEMEHFMDVPASAVRLLSIGTMSVKVNAGPAESGSGGMFDWGTLNPLNMPKRLFGLAISSSETTTDYMLRHRLTEERYFRADDNVDGTLEKSVELDCTNEKARRILRRFADDRARKMLNEPLIRKLLAYSAATNTFHYGARAVRGEQAYA